MDFTFEEVFQIQPLIEGSLCQIPEIAIHDSFLTCLNFELEPACSESLLLAEHAGREIPSIFEERDEPETSLGCPELKTLLIDKIGHSMLSA